MQSNSNYAGNSSQGNSAYSPGSRSGQSPTSIREWRQANQNRGAQGDSGCSIHGCENVGSTERIVSAGLGGLLVASGIFRGRLPGLLLTAAGASLLYRGISGHCALYQQLGLNTNELEDEQSGQQSSHAGSIASAASRWMAPDHDAIKGVKVEETFEIARSKHDLYDIWTRWEQLPKFLPHISKIENMDSGKTRWTAKGPMGAELTWEAETIRQDADRMVSWKSTSGDVGTAGSVHFDDIGNGKTRMRVSMQYDPPGGKTTAMIAEFLGVGLDERVRKDLQEFKKRVESGASENVQGAHAATNVSSKS